MHNECMGTFGLHGLILCGSEGFLSLQIQIHNKCIVCIGTFDLHGLILCVSEGYFCHLLCIHIVDIGTFDPHELILCVSEGSLRAALCSHCGQGNFRPSWTDFMCVLRLDF